MQHRRFFGFFVGICFAGYALLIGMGRSPLYCRFSHTLFDAAPCFKAGMSGIDADILVVGDSSLLYGIRPDLVAAAGGGKVYNLGMIGLSFSYQVSELIDSFLASNKRPRAIVLYFGPYETISHDRLIDPMWAPLGVYLLRHGSGANILRFLTIRPSSIVEMPSVIWTGLTTAGPRLNRFAVQMKATGGFADYPPGNRVLTADCRTGSFKRPALALGDNRAPLAALRQRYRAMGIPLFVYMAPTAICDNRISAIRQANRGILDNVPLALPNEDFSDDTPEANHVHASPAGVVAFSNEFAKFSRATVQPKLHHL